MSLYESYLEEIEERKGMGLNPKPIDDESLANEVISQIKDNDNKYREDSLNYFIYNMLPGTTGAANAKAHFLKEIVTEEFSIDEISPDFALELLSHMKGGPSIEVLLDLALEGDEIIAKKAGDALKTQVFLYEADTERLRKAFAEGNEVAKNILQSYSKAEFFTKLPEIKNEIKIVTYIAAEGDISTDLLSPGTEAHSRSDRELHGKCMISAEAQSEIQHMQKQHPDKRIMLIAEKGTMGVGSSRTVSYTHLRAHET